MINKVLIFNFIYLFLTFSSAHAYLDPGTGSIIVQAILGLLAAIAVALKLYWHKFLKLIGIRKNISLNDKNNPDQDNQN